MDKATRVLKDEKGHERGVKCLNADKKHVEITQVTTCKDGKVHMAYVIDLSGLTVAEILENCATNVNIQVVRPRHFRQLTCDQVIKLHGSMINPKDFPAEGREKLSDYERAEKDVRKLSKEEFAQLKKEYEEELNK